MDRKIFLIGITYLLHLLHCCIAKADSSIEDSLIFHHLTSHNGLSDNSVIAIAQDSRGFMWFGTPSGLNRYDGREIMQFKSVEDNPNSLSSSSIVSLMPEADGGMWIGTSQGLNYYNPVTDSFQRIYLTPLEKKFNNKNRIHCIFRDSRGRLWIGTGIGLFCMQNSKFTRYIFNADKTGNQKIKALYEDSHHNIWVAASNGLIRLTLTNNSGRGKYVIYNKNKSDKEVVAFAEDSSKRLWIGSDDGILRRFVHSNNTFVSSSTPSWSISDLITDRYGNLWIAGPDQLTVMNTSSGKMKMFRHNPENPNGLSSEHTLSLFEDRAGSIWVGSYRGGVNVSHLTDRPFRLKKHCFTSSGVNTITGNKQSDLLIGTEVGLCLSNHKSGIQKQFSKDLTGIKTAILSKDGSVWAGSSKSGLWHFSVEQQIKNFNHLPEDTNSLNSDYVICLLEDSRQRLWVGTVRGLNLLDKSKARFIKPGRAIGDAITGPIQVLFEDSKQNIWIGTQRGIALMRAASGSFEWFPIISQQSIIYSKSGVACFYEDQNNKIWIGCYQTGLKQYDASKNSLISYSTPGLPEDVINLIEDNYGKLWFSSLTTLYKLDTSTNQVRPYNFNDRISEFEINELTSYKSETGDLFFGTNRGLLQFSPADVRDNTVSPPVLFTSFHIFGEKTTEIDRNQALLRDAVENNHTLVLQHGDDSFTIGFSVLNFIKASKNKFAYKMEGLHNDWNYTQTPFATFSRLPPGQYILYAKGANNDDLWSKTPAALKIIVLPPWWKTWWAYCFYILLTLTFVFLLIRFFWLRAMLKKELETHEEKLHFFTTVSHEMRSHLMLISAPIEKLLQSEKMTRTARRQLASIYNNSSRLSSLMKELMDFRKAEQGHLQLHVQKYELISFLKAIFYSFSELAESRKITSSFINEVQSIELWFDPEEFEKVVYNLLSNAYKFTPENGFVSMRIQDDSQSVSILVTNSGTGIAQENLDKIFTNYFQVYQPGVTTTGHGIGLALSKSIVERHKGELSVTSNVQKHDKYGFTTFTIKIKKGNLHFSSEQLVEKDDATFDSDRDQLPKFDLEPSTDANEKKPIILLAENNTEFRNMLFEALSEHSNVITCSNGKEAYSTSITLIPDLIVSDIMMPEIDGLEFCKKIKTHPATSHIPFIIFTAHDPQIYQEKGLESGADAYISKPFRLKILELKIRNLLAAQRAIQQKFSSQILLEPGNVVVVNNREEKFVVNILKFVEENMDNPQFTVTMLSKHMGMSEPVLYKKVRALLNMTVNDFIKTIRFKKAKKMLKAGISTAEVSLSVGYADPKYFSREFKKAYGVTPSKWININESIED